MELQLTDKEHELLSQILEEQQKHLLREIAKAHHHAFKSSLRDRCTVLEGMLSKLKAPAHSAA